MLSQLRWSVLIMSRYLIVIVIKMAFNQILYEANKSKLNGKNGEQTRNKWTPGTYSYKNLGIIILLQ